MTNHDNPAYQLEGKLLTEGWKVIKRFDPSHKATGGNFSVGYIVESPNGERGFLKALDYSWAFKFPDPPLALKSMTSAYIFERDILRKCKESHLSRVVRAIADGKYDVPGGGVISSVDYLIFELADGDARKYLEIAGMFNTAWALRCLHHITTGLHQLHKQGIAHQDLKPSNVLVFQDKSSKVGDVGRAAYKGHLPPHENDDIPGDRGYAPPELLYGYVDPDWNCRRLGCDTYLLGSLVVFFFMNINLTSAILNELHPSHRYKNWAGSYLDVLPYIRDAFSKVIEKFEEHVDPSFREELSNIVRQLCDPDPHLRGHPLNRMGLRNPFSLERYVSKFNLLARKAEFGYFGRSK